MTDISNKAIMSALYAIRGELQTCDELLSQEDTTESERDAAADQIMELTSAFGEFAALYKERQAINETLPPFADLF